MASSAAAARFMEIRGPIRRSIPRSAQVRSAGRLLDRSARSGGSLDISPGGATAGPDYSRDTPTPSGRHHRAGTRSSRHAHSDRSAVRGTHDCSRPSADRCSRPLGSWPSPCPPLAVSRALKPGRRPAPGQPRVCSSRRDSSPPDRWLIDGHPWPLARHPNDAEEAALELDRLLSDPLRYGVQGTAGFTLEIKPR